MRRHTRAGSLALILVLVALPTFAHPSPEEQELRKLEQEWCEAYQQRDTQTLDRLLAADFIFTDDEGQVYDKPHYLAAVLQQVVTAYTLGEMRIRVYGDTGVVTSPISWHYTIAGKAAGGEFRSTDVFVKRQGHWQIVASQDTRIPKQP
jgi:ketosteroid isomerase-like protein